MHIRLYLDVSHSYASDVANARASWFLSLWRDGERVECAFHVSPGAFVIVRVYESVPHMSGGRTHMLIHILYTKLCVCVCVYLSV